MPLSANFAPTKAWPFVALLWREDLIAFEDIKLLLENKLGECCNLMQASFDSMSSYYQNEMGLPLKRCYWVGKKAIEREQLVELKKWTMDLEAHYSKEGRRQINLDPGLLCLEQTVLISTKPYSHRLYISDNLYLELNTLFEKASYRPLPWTYPDYSRPECLEFFNQQRAILRNS